MQEGVGGWGWGCLGEEREREREGGRKGGKRLPLSAYLYKQIIADVVDNYIFYVGAKSI